MAIALDVLNVGQNAQDSAGSTIALTTGSNVAAGATIIVTATCVRTQSLLSVADDGPGLIWTIDKQGEDVPSSAVAGIASAYAVAGMASGTTITVTFSTSTAGGRSITATSFTGVKTSSPVDNTSGPTAFASTTDWTSASTAISAGSLLVAVADNTNSLRTSTPTAPSLEAHDLGNGGFSQTTCYRIEASGGSYTVAGTFSAAVDGAVVAAAYLAEPAGAGNVVAWLTA